MVVVKGCRRGYGELVLNGTEFQFCQMKSGPGDGWMVEMVHSLVDALNTTE